MKRSSYREQDYAFGQIMLTLRSTMGLTQSGLAELLGVSRRSVADWEAGSKYPKAEHLKSFIALALERQAFPAGREADEIRALWQAAHVKVLLDEVWPGDKQTQTVFPSAEETASAASVASTRRVDWGAAFTVQNFYGREWELALLTEWVVEERCRVVSVLGLGGIGKSTLVVRLMQQVAGQFDVVIWRSLRDLPTCEALLDDCLQVFASPTPGGTVTLEQRQTRLLEHMRRSRVLLVFDNVESILEEGESAGRIRPGYEGFGRVLRLSAETMHQSCVLLTSREKPSDLVPLEGNRSPVRVLRLMRLDVDSCERLLEEKDIAGTSSERARLIEAYAGNPLALKIVSQTLVNLFDGEIAPFLEQGEVIFGGVRDLLSEQFTRLSPLEQSVLLWLAILREPASLDELLVVLAAPVPRARLLEALEALSRRSLIERGQERGSFTLQSVVLEYLTAHLIAEVSSEIEQNRVVRLVEHGLMLAQGREYVRQTQERLIAAPILTHLRSAYRQQALVEERLLSLLADLTGWADNIQGYAPANLLLLLRLLRGSLRDLDLSRLALRGVYLQGVEMQDTRLVNAIIQDTIFTETFDAMTSVAISRSGEYWAAASRRGEIRIWEAGGRLLRQAWRGHADMVWALAFNADGQTLASGSWDAAVKVWDVSSGALLWSGRHTSHITRVAFAPDGRTLASAGSDATARLWDSQNGTLLQTLAHPSPVTVVTWSPDGHLLASGDAEGHIRLWRMRQTEPKNAVPMLLKHTNHVDGLAFAPDGYTLASGDWDGTVKLWEVSSGRLLQTLTGHTDRVARLAWSPDGRTLASSSSDQTILLWDVEQGSYRALLKGHREGVYELAFTPDSRTLLSSSRDDTLRVWDVMSGQCVRVIYGYSASVYDVDWSPDSTQLVSGGTDTVVTRWDVTHGTPVQVLQGHIGVVCAVGWSSDGRWLASSESEHAIRLWDLTSGADSQFLQHPDDSGNYFYGLAWSPDGRRLASGTNQGGVAIWDVIAHTQEAVGRQFSVRFPLAAWSPDGKRLAGGGDDGSVYLWNVAEDALEQRLVGHHSLIKSLAWSLDGTRLASGASGEQDGELFVWDVLRGECLHTFAGHAGIVSAVAWGSSGEWLISGGADGNLSWWDVGLGERLRVQEAHQGTVQSLKRSPDGSKLASCGDDGAIMLWDLRSGAYLQTLRRDRPYERLNITGIKGLSEAQKATLRALGAIEEGAL